ncbi:MAG: hypothetical protein ACRD97_07245 [Nitrososphaeraceae archaeon]
MNRRVLDRGMTVLAGTVIVTTLMLMTAPSVFAASPDLTIETFGIDDEGNPFLTVKGTAGGTTPDETGDIYAYVFFTDDGIYAVTSHPGVPADSNEGDGSADWHGHKVKLSDENCVTDINDDSKAALDGNTASVENTDATSVDKVLTAVLSTEKEGGICVAKVFDSQE